MRCLLLCGSARQPSYTRSLLQQIAVLLEERGLTCTLWDVRDRPIPLFEPGAEGHLAYHPDSHVRALGEAAATADCFVWGSPVYHHSYSSTLKNMLDYLEQETLRKPIGLVGTGQQAVDHLRQVAGGMRGVAIPTRVVTAKADFAPEGDGFVLTNPTLLKRCERFADDLIWFAQKLRG